MVGCALRNPPYGLGDLAEVGGAFVLDWVVGHGPGEVVEEGAGRV